MKHIRFQFKGCIFTLMFKCCKSDIYQLYRDVTRKIEWTIKEIPINAEKSRFVGKIIKKTPNIER